MIDALIVGTICRKPIERMARNGSAFVTTTIRVPTRDDRAQFVTVISFSTSAIAALLPLGEGDPVALVGELTAKAYLNKTTGDPAPSLDLLAHAVLSPYAVQRKRQATQSANTSQRDLPLERRTNEPGAQARESRKCYTPPPPAEKAERSAPGEPYFDDLEIPF